MSPFLILILYLAISTNLILGSVILAQGIKNKINILFSLITLSTAVWGISITGFHLYTFLDKTTWIGLSHVSALILSYFFLHFSLSYPFENQIKLDRLILALSTLPLAILSYAIFNSEVVIGRATNISYEIGPGYGIYALFIIVYFSTGFLFLLKKRNKVENPILKKQLGYVIIGSVLPSSLAVITDLILPYLGIFNLTWAGPIFTLILVFAIFFSILKYGLFNIKVITTELLTFTLWIFILARAVISDTTQDLVVNATLLVLTVTVGIFLIRSVLREVQTREKIEKLAGELELANEQLKQLDRQKSEFVSIASHQLRSPLTAIKGYSSLILEGSFGEVSDKVRGAVDTIFQSSQSLVVVIENFLNISRIEQGRMSYQFADLELVAFVKGIIDQLTPNAQKKGLAVSFEVKEGNHYTIKADAEKVRQVILNLFDNSIKYTPSGSIKLSLVRENNTSPIRLTIADTGIGMTHETQTRLFQKFSRADDAGKVNAGGAGLGLFLAAEIMKAHKGSVHAESDGPGKGSRFIVEFAD